MTSTASRWPHWWSRPTLRPLELSVAGDIAVEGADRSDVDRVLPTVPWHCPDPV
jgi:hypothetical protein